MALEPRDPRRADYDTDVIDLTKDSDSNVSINERAEDSLKDAQNHFDEYYDQEEEEEIEWHRVPVHLRPSDLPELTATVQEDPRPERTLSIRSPSSSSSMSSSDDDVLVLHPPLSIRSSSSSSSPSSSSSSSGVLLLVPHSVRPPVPSAGTRPRTQRTHRAFVAEIVPALNQIYDGGPDHLRRSIMEELEEDNILPAYHLSEADLVLSMTWARFAHEYGHIGSTNQYQYLTEYMTKYGTILLKVNGFNAFKHFLIMLLHNRKLENPSRPDLPGLKIAFKVGQKWKEIQERYISDST